MSPTSVINGHLDIFMFSKNITTTKRHLLSRAHTKIIINTYIFAPCTNVQYLHRKKIRCLYDVVLPPKNVWPKLPLGGGNYPKPSGLYAWWFIILESVKLKKYSGKKCFRELYNCEMTFIVRMFYGRNELTFFSECEMEFSIAIDAYSVFTLSQLMDSIYKSPINYVLFTLTRPTETAVSTATISQSCVKYRSMSKPLFNA